MDEERLMGHALVHWATGRHSILHGQAGVERLGEATTPSSRAAAILSSARHMRLQGVEVTDRIWRGLKRVQCTHVERHVLLWKGAHIFDTSLHIGFRW